MVKRKHKDSLVNIGSLYLGEYTDGEVAEWELDPDQRIVDAINESRDISIKKLQLFVMLPSET